jgi:hypothetical protein
LRGIFARQHFRLRAIGDSIASPLTHLGGDHGEEEGHEEESEEEVISLLIT